MVLGRPAVAGVSLSIAPGDARPISPWACCPATSDAGWALVLPGRRCLPHDVRQLISASKVCALPDGVGFSNPGGELVIELGLFPDPVVVHEQRLGVRRHRPDPRVCDLALEV
jgi:hypothetical protein